MASTICGASCPVVITSRADTGQQVLFHPDGRSALPEGVKWHLIRHSKGRRKPSPRPFLFPKPCTVGILML